MFSSNQVFQISGTMDMLPAVIDLGFLFSGERELFTRKDDPLVPYYKIINPGYYCLSADLKGDREMLEEGWKEFPFYYDPDILAKIIRQWLERQPIHHSDGDGLDETGFLCLSMGNDAPEDVDIDEWEWPGTLAFRPFSCYYAK